MVPAAVNERDVGSDLLEAGPPPPRPARGQRIQRQSRQYFYLARVRAWSADAGDRDGPEFTDPARGEYHLQAIPLNARVLAAIDLKPDPLAELLLDHLRAGTDLFSFLTFAPEQRTALAELRFHWADAYPGLRPRSPGWAA